MIGANPDFLLVKTIFLRNFLYLKFYIVDLIKLSNIFLLVFVNFLFFNIFFNIDIILKIVYYKYNVFFFKKNKDVYLV
jgi:hypothetical protein